MLDWGFSPNGYAGSAESPIPPELEMALPDYGETVRPDFAVRELDPPDDASKWQLLVRVLEPARTSTVSSAAAVSSRPPRTDGWSGSCAKRVCRPACS